VSQQFSEEALPYFSTLYSENAYHFSVSKDTIKKPRYAC